MTTSEAPTDNGVNVQALLDARTALVDAPEGGAVHLARQQRVGQGHAQPERRSTASSASAASRATAPRGRFDADHPEVFASEDNGPTPVEYVLVGLASCLTAGIAAVAQNRGIQLNSVKATIEGDMDILGILGGDPETRNGFNEIRVHYDIDADATPEEIEALVAQSQKRSAVFDAVTNPTNVTVHGQLSRSGLPVRTTTVVIGAGHSGLAVSHFLSRRSIDHVVSSAGRSPTPGGPQRWDSLRLLTPNWLSAPARLRLRRRRPRRLHDHARGDRVHRPATPLRSTPRCGPARP